MKNPFIRYKIYSSFEAPPHEGHLLKQNVRVLCLISNGELDKKPFLKKILSAAKISEAGYQILSLPEQGFIPASVNKWFDQLDYILFFGLPPTAADIHIPPQIYQSSNIRNTTILQLPVLQKIESDKKEKQKLWQLLKNEFLND